MPDQELQIEQLETQFPSASAEAFAAARRQVLASGQSVLQAEDGVIYRVSPSGGKWEVKRIEPPSVVRRGQKFRLK